MGDDSRFNRREFVRSAGAAVAGVLGVTGRAESTVGGSNAEETNVQGSTAFDPGANPEKQGEQGTDPDGGIRRLRMVLPVVEPLETTYVNVAIVVGAQILPGERPPPRCLPEVGSRWLAYDAAVVDLTESSLLGGDGNAVGTVARTRAYAAREPRRNTPYRVVGGTNCDGYVRVTVHELADQFEIAVETSG